MRLRAEYISSEATTQCKCEAHDGKPTMGVGREGEKQRGSSIAEKASVSHTGRATFMNHLD